MEKVMIEFENGIKVEAEVNGDSYIVDEKPDFPIGLTTVEIENNGELTLLNNVRIVECASIDSNYWFAIVQASDEDVWRAEIEDALCELSME